MFGQRFEQQSEQTVVYGENNLGLSISKAFLVLTPKSNESKFKHVENRRGANFDAQNITYSSIQSEQMSKFEAGLKNSNQYSFISSIPTQSSIESLSQTECTCCNNNTILNNTQISFNVNMASTPKVSRKVKRISYCNECQQQVPVCCLNDQNVEKTKKRKLSQEIKREKILFNKFDDVTTSTNILGCNAYFKNFLKKKSNKKSINDVTTSTKKGEYKLKLKTKVPGTKYSELKGLSKKSSSRVKKAQKLGNLLTDARSIPLDNLNIFTQSNLSNNFNQFGQFQVWYV